MIWQKKNLRWICCSMWHLTLQNYYHNQGSWYDTLNWEFFYSNIIYEFVFSKHYFNPNAVKSEKSGFLFLIYLPQGARLHNFPKKKKKKTHKTQNPKPQLAVSRDTERRWVAYSFGTFPLPNYSSEAPIFLKVALTFCLGVWLPRKWLQYWRNL